MRQNLKQSVNHVRQNLKYNLTTIIQLDGNVSFVSSLNISQASEEIYPSLLCSLPSIDTSSTISETSNKESVIPVINARIGVLDTNVQVLIILIQVKIIIILMATRWHLHVIQGNLVTQKTKIFL